ncbi:MAG: 3-hydroxybutyryl-CoA dehydrogenase, partial [Phormidesmis sp. FL-bin-119]|nr:3-hydroxybutyryl-CoA dehydrogenase [Pedobacter sp.]
MKVISVIGSGTMGNGIAHTFALSGFKVNIIDLSNDKITEALSNINRNLDRQEQKGIITKIQQTNTLLNIEGFTQLETGVKESDLVIEAATE